MPLTFTNESFETADPGQPGGAAGWTMGSSCALQQIAAFGPSTPPVGWEGYELGWGNNDYLYEFTQLDVLVATFTGPPWVTHAFEGFEGGWDNDDFAYSLALIEEAGFTHGGAPGPNAETFEGGWLGNESYVFSFGSPAMDITESFETLWRGNENYIYDFVPGDVSIEQFGEGWTGGSGITVDYEGFEAVYPFTQMFSQFAVDQFFVPGGHGLEADEPVYARNDDGALPTPLQAGRRYFVRIVTANAFELAYVAGGARIDTTDDGYGEHYVYADPVWFWNTEVDL